MSDSTSFDRSKQFPIFRFAGTPHTLSFNTSQGHFDPLDQGENCRHNPSWIFLNIATAKPNLNTDRAALVLQGRLPGS